MKWRMVKRRSLVEKRMMKIRDGDEEKNCRKGKEKKHVENRVMKKIQDIGNRVMQKIERKNWGIELWRKATDKKERERDRKERQKKRMKEKSKGVKRRERDENRDCRVKQMEKK